MELTAQEAWSRILESARARLPEQSYSTWLAPTRPIALSSDQLTIGAPSAFAVEWIEHKYGELLADSARQLFGESFAVTVEAAADTEAARAGSAPIDLTPEPMEEETGTPAPAEPLGPAAARRESGGGCVVGTLNPRYTLDRFVVGGNNQLSTAACQAVASAPGQAYNPLFIYGGVGLGKTHLMHGIGHAVLERFPDRRIAYVATEQFMNELIAAIQKRSTPGFRRRYREIDLLLVDDIHFLADKEGTQEEFFHTFNALYDAQKQIVLTSDRPPKEIPGLQERLVSRFEWGLVADVQPPDFETRVAILHQKAAEDGLSIDDAVLAFIAERCRSSVRELEGAIIKLLAYSSLTCRAITLDLAGEALGATMAAPRSVTPESIRSAVAEEYGVSVDDLCSGDRSRTITRPRQVAMYLIRRLLDSSYTEIGRLFGGRDHSTVIHSVRKIAKEAESDTELRERLQGLEASLG